MSRLMTITIPNGADECPTKPEMCSDCRDEQTQLLANMTGSVFYRGRRLDGTWLTTNDRDQAILECPTFVGYVPKQNQDRGLFPPAKEVDPVITVIRVLKYTGTEEWVRKSLAPEVNVVKPGEPYSVPKGNISELWRG